MTLNGIYIDDDLDAKRLVPRLESQRLKITLREPGDLVTLAEEITNQHPAVVVLDYRLDQALGSRNESVTYRAAPLAQQMRDLIGTNPEYDFPIVLISSEDKIRTLYRPEKTAHDLFDWKFIKNNVGQSDIPARVLLGLADGYSRLRENIGKFDSLNLFAIDEEHRYLVDSQELQETLKEAEYPHIAARYLLNYLIRRQGILLDRASLYARLGIIAPTGEPLAALEAWLAPSRYSGVFYGCCERWWSSLFEDLFSDLFDGPVGRFTAAQRAEQLCSSLGQPYEAAKDRWIKSADFIPVFACASCKSPTPLRHSLSCLDARLPSFVQRQRICYTCIQTDQLQEIRTQSDDDWELRLDATEQRIADRIRMGQLLPEAS